MKRGMKKMILVYGAAGVGLILLMGFIAFFLGVADCFSQETNQIVTETAASLFGSLYLAFLFWAIHPKNQSKKMSFRSGRLIIMSGLIFFAARIVNRFLLAKLLLATPSKAPYFFSAALDLAALGALWLFIPYTGKGEASHE